jgi:hypothetical protein
MPNRIIREGILTSEKFERLGWAEEIFYRRIMSVVDDYGRYYAKPALLRAACYPLLLQKVSDSDIEKWLTACVNSALVRVYPAKDGKRYLEILDFRQQVRSNTSKFPAYDEQLHSTCIADATHMISNAHLDGDVSVFVDEDDKRSPSGESFERFWSAYPKKVGKANAIKEWKKASPDIESVLQSLSRQKAWRENPAEGEFIPAWKDPERWIKAGCWNDEVSVPEEQDEWAAFPRS